MTQEEIKAIGIEALIMRDEAIDPKYRPAQFKLLHIEKKYLIPSDEPIYVLRGNDPAAPFLARRYREILIAEEQSEIVIDHLDTSAERVNTFNIYHKNNPDKVGRIYDLKDRWLYTDEQLEALANCPLDPKQDPEYAFWDFKLFCRDERRFVDDDEPVMIFRGKDAALVMVIDEHNNFIASHFELYAKDDIDRLIKYNELRKEAVKMFHIEHPERVGVTCAIFQKPKSEKYKKALNPDFN